MPKVIRTAIGVSPQNFVVTTLPLVWQLNITAEGWITCGLTICHNGFLFPSNHLSTTQIVAISAPWDSA